MELTAMILGVLLLMVVAVIVSLGLAPVAWEFGVTVLKLIVVCIVAVIIAIMVLVAMPATR